MHTDFERIRQVFLAIVERPSAQWEALLEETCAEDAELRQQVVLLLKAHAGGEGILDRNEVGRAPTGVYVPLSERPGTVIGQYKLLQVIGEGGMGTVFMAEQTRPVQRKVALKVIKSGMGSRQVIARFEAERQALAMMDHVNIARVLDAGATETGLPYFVMELVHGVPITKFCDDNHLTPRERLELFVPVCAAIQHAHQKGIIHRDVKPSNVLVTLYDGKPVPKVIDFGVAKAIEQKLTERTLFTQFGTMIGTLEYMSPEQAEMSALGVDTRSDVYSLGVLLYELLTGSTPLTHKRMKEGAYAEILRMIKEEEPPRPSTRLSDSGEALASISVNRHMQPANLTRLVRGELDWIVMKTLEKDRNRRYDTANAFGADVQRYLNDEQVLACPPSAGYRLRKFARRNKGKLAIAAGVFLAVTVMAASIGWAVRDRVARQAEIERAETVRLAKVEGQVHDSLNTARILIAENKLASAREKLVQARVQLGNDWSALGNLAAEIEAGEADLDRFQQFLDLIDRAHQAETASLLEPTLAADGSHGSAGTPAPARTGNGEPPLRSPSFFEALQRYDVLDHDDWNSTLAGGLLGRQQVEQIRRLAYEELLWLAADVFHRQQEHRSERKLSPQAAARQALVYLGKAESAHRATQALYALRARCRKTLGEEAAAQADTQLADKTPPTMALDHSLRGQAAYDAKQLAEGVQAFEAALRLEPTHYWSLMWLGYCLCELGRGPEDFTGAATAFTGCILKRPDHAHAYYCRANAYSRLGRYEYALADFSRTIELDPQHARVWFNRGNTYNKLGKPDKALADFSRAIEVDPTFAGVWNNRGNTYSNLGKPDKALTDYSRAVELDPKYAHAWSNRGTAYHKLGKLDEAVADYSRAIELDPNLAHAWYNRGNTYHKLGKKDKAVADFTRAIEVDPKHANAWYNRGNTYHGLNRLDEALSDYSRAIELDPKGAHAWFSRGLAYHKLGKHDKTVADFSKVIELAPNHPEMVNAYLLRAQANTRLAHFEQARTDYQTFLKRTPAQAGPHNALAWLLATCPDAKLRDPDQAVELARKAVQLGPKVGTYWKTLGVAHYRAGDWKAAVAALDKSVELPKGANAGVLLFLAMSHRKLGNHNEARKAYGQAVGWLEKYKEALEKDKGYAEELRRFRAEAEEVLELKKK